MIMQIKVEVVEFDGQRGFVTGQDDESPAGYFVVVEVEGQPGSVPALGVQTLDGRYTYRGTFIGRRVK
jgi:hypothetical protein